jgi:hypothetical protein
LLPFFVQYKAYSSSVHDIEREIYLKTHIISATETPLPLIPHKSLQRHEVKNKIFVIGDVHGNQLKIVFLTGILVPL